MNSFTQGVLNVLLLWLKTAITSMWDVVNSDGTRTGLIWLGNNWLFLVIALIIVGVVIDYVVWLVRWRPFYVWRSNWHRFKRHFSREQDDDRQDQPVRHRTPAAWDVNLSKANAVSYGYPTPQGPVEQVYRPFDSTPVSQPDAYNRPQVYQNEQANRPYAPSVHRDEFATEYTAGEPMGNDSDLAYDPAYKRTRRLKALPVEDTQAYTVYRSYEDSADHDTDDRLRADEHTPDMAGVSAGFDPYAPYDAYALEEVNNTGYSDGFDHGYDVGYGVAPEQPVDQADTDTDPQPLESRRAPRSGRTVAKKHNGMLSGIGKVARTLKEGLSNNDDDEDLGVYVPPKPRVSKRQAFHTPVYPPNWQGQCGDDNPDFREDE